MEIMKENFTPAGGDAIPDEYLHMSDALNEATNDQRPECREGISSVVTSDPWGWCVKEVNIREVNKPPAKVYLCLK